MGTSRQKLKHELAGYQAARRGTQDLLLMTPYLRRALLLGRILLAIPLFLLLGLPALPLLPSQHVTDSIEAERPSATSEHGQADGRSW